MPLYEYYCRDCKTRFELLRPVGRMNDPASCPAGHAGGERVLSTFAALSKGSEGQHSALGGSGCAGCAGGACSTCNLN